MRVKVYPADQAGCGYYRMIWPAEALRGQGHDVTVMDVDHRNLALKIDRGTDTVSDVMDDPAADCDVMVFQRLTHPWMAQAVPILRSKGVAVVIDMDDDLNSIHPRNPAWTMMHPKRAAAGSAGPRQLHSWSNLAQACRDATMVTVSTPALLPIYGHGHGRVIPNYLPDSYFRRPRVDSQVVSWPASLHSHPDDPMVTGGALARLVEEDNAGFYITGDPTGCGAAFGLPGNGDPLGTGPVDLEDWPERVRQIGIGISPLADTKFNRSKSWLKPLEMSALGVPWVASPRAEYQRLNALGAGVLADTPRRWYRELARLRDSAAARWELTESGRAAVDDLRIERQAWRWLEVWSDALALQKVYGVSRSAAASSSSSR
jgi:hypothetical protein